MSVDFSFPAVEIANVTFCGPEAILENVGSSDGIPFSPLEIGGCKWDFGVSLISRTMVFAAGGEHSHILYRSMPCWFRVSRRSIFELS
jgi:hypothetical protein